MKKSTKLVKRFLALFLLVLLSCENFAAVVSDDDGGAFVSKAEFESMKKEFDAQLLRYNSSLGNKIDGKIADYLNGLKIEKRQDIKKLLDENGVYDEKYYLYWNSKSNVTSLTDDPHYAVQTINCQILGYDPAGPDNEYWWGNNYNWTDLYGNTENTNLDPTPVANLVYVYDDDGITLKETQLYYEKVKNYITWQYYFQFYQNRGSSYDGAYYRSDGSISYAHYNIIDDNQSDFNQQNLKNWPMTYLRAWRSRLSLWDVWKQCYVTITQEEQKAEKDDKFDLLLLPFSTKKEYIWDKTDASEILTWSDPIQTAIKSPTGEPLLYPNGWQPINGNPNYELQLETYGHFWFPWQTIEDTSAIKERKIKNLIDANTKNKAAENGVVVGTIPEQNGDLTIYLKVRVDKPGNVYVYIGDDPIKNWKDADFKGKKVTITSDDGSKLIEYEGASKNQTVWVLYELNPVQDANYKLYIDEFYYMAI